MARDTVTSIIWFRQDLRLADNPALIKAAQADNVLAIYILDDINAKDQAIGAASRWWLHHSLTALNAALGGKLNFYKGDTSEIIRRLVKAHRVSDVCWNRCYEPWRINYDGRIKTQLTAGGVNVHSFNASLLWEPWEVLKSDGTPYKVFTPFYRKGCLSKPPPRRPLPVPEKISAIIDESALPLVALDLLPKTGWDAQLAPHWQIGETAAQERLYAFLDEGVSGYKTGRDFPSRENVSRLSPYLHTGEISPHQVWHAAHMRGDGTDVDHFCAELGWRELSYGLLYHFPALPHANWQKNFDAFPWQRNNGFLVRWQKGMTGYPIVDAGMRELWQTGYMHNRIRMVVASFLVKNLLIDWRHGAAWFWDCLVDADLANNSASWQWVAGSGADAAPYFRVFNPVTQGEKFDSDGAYTRKYVPELAGMPDKYLFKPWAAPADVLQKAGVTLGKSYPMPIVDLALSRTKALEAYAEMKARLI